MNDFSTLDEIEKYLIEIFGNKINALENKQRVYEKVLKKSDQHQLAGTEAGAVGKGLGDGFAVPAVGVGEAAQLLGDGDQFGGDSQVVQAGHAQDAWAHTELGFCGQQGLEAGVMPTSGDAADDVGGCLCLACPFRYAHHHSDRASLVGDGVEAFGQGALLAGLTRGSEHVGEQDGLVEGKDRGVGILRGADHAHHGSGDGANGAGALVEFEDADAVMVVGHWGSSWWA